jgi:hypothetical protein
MIFDEVVTLKPDEVITNERLEEVLGRPLGQNRSPVYRAIKELERNHRRTLATVRGTGYRVVHPEEHLGLALSHSSRARTELKRGIERVEAADRGNLEPSVAARLEAFEATTSRLVEFLGRMAVAVDDQARILAEVKQTAEGTDERVQAVEAALKRHGLM